ncbi:MAG: tRNA pseudouridine(55) synthase TruB [Flavobacteriaceae bacterium]|nr:tRNA pseudouridine(55) synthase TruB [Flavobacteriaceae bacterium]
MDSQYEGELILVDKPLYYSSFEVVNEFKKLVYPSKIGHAGTLDPLATGLLILCTGKKTKIIEQIQCQEKIYTGRILLGSSTESYDLETPLLFGKDTSQITEELVLKTVQKLTGEILQQPPAHSAVKVGGKRLYELARADKEIPARPRQVTVHEFNITKIDLPTLHFKIRCSKGTYIRTLANDIGNLLGCGACLTSLRREKIGEFEVENARRELWGISTSKSERLKEKVANANNLIYIQNTMI